MLLALLRSTGTPLIYASRRLWPLELCGFYDEVKANHRENMIPGMKQTKNKENDKKTQTRFIVVVKG